MAQVTEPAFGSDIVKDLNALLARARAWEDISLENHKLYKTTLRIHSDADASYATNGDESSQIGFIILLCVGTGRAHVISFSSRKSWRVVRSAMAGEVFAFITALDEAFTLRFDLEMLYDQHIPLSIFTDSMQLFDVVTRASHPTEKRLLIDVAAAREACNRMDISNVCLVKSEDNMSDALTKVKPCTALDRPSYRHRLYAGRAIGHPDGCGLPRG